MPAVVLATVAIYLTVVAACLAAGIAIRAWLAPRGRWVTASTLPLGLCGATVALYPLAVLMPARLAVPALLGAVAVALALAAARRARGARSRDGRGSLASALTPTRADGTLLGLGVLGGLAVLIPVLRLGFPTTLALDVADAFNYAARADALHGARLTPGVGGVDGVASGIGLGFELLANIPMALLGRDSYEVVAATAAVAIPVAIAGWGCLLRAVSDRHLGTREALVVPVAAVSPLFLTPFFQSQVTQLLSLAIWPFAVAATLALARRVSLPRLVAAALGVAGVVGAYPALAPWLVPALAVCLLARPEGGEGGERPIVRVRHASALATVLALAVVALAPIQSFRALHYVTIIDTVKSWSAFPVLDPSAYAVLLAGAESPFAFLGGSALGWGAVAAAMAIGGVAVDAGVRLARTGEPGARVHWALGLTVAAVTVAALVNYLWLGESQAYGYGAVKAVISGGAILGGLVAIALARPAGAGAGWPRRLALVACVAVWLPASWQVMERSVGAEQGIRAQDVALAGALRELPARSPVLASTTAESAAGDKLRRSAEHFTTLHADHDLLNVGQYGAEREPGRAWSYVVSARGPSPFGAGRVVVWQDAHYRLAAAPALDAAPLGDGWLAAGPAEARVGGAVAGRAVVGVSNRGGAPRLARLRLVVRATAGPAHVDLRAGARMARAYVPAGRAAPVALLVDVPAGGVARVKLRAAPAGGSGAGDAAVRVARVALTPVGVPGGRQAQVALRPTR